MLQRIPSKDDKLVEGSAILAEFNGKVWAGGKNSRVFIKQVDMTRYDHLGRECRHRREERRLRTVWCSRAWGSMVTEF